MFKVKFLEEAKKFLDSLDEKPRNKIFTISGNLKYPKMKNFSRNLTMKSGSSEHFITKVLIDYLHFGMKPRNQ
jgi:mRNA-degrading endonuclease RelE of RelBE toxin-antitoxin system